MNLDKINHYAYAMTKPHPSGCFKKQKGNYNLERVQPDDKTSF